VVVVDRCGGQRPKISDDELAAIDVISSGV
jgi:hypothetical protein